MQLHFDYACSAWYPNLNKKFKSKLQTIKNKCIRYCPQLDNRSHIGMKAFGKINWLSIFERIRTFSHFLVAVSKRFLLLIDFVNILL